MQRFSQPLVHRTNLLPDEALLSLLMRLTELNSYESITILKGLILETPVALTHVSDDLELPSKSTTYEKLTMLTQLDVFSLYMATLHRFAPILTPLPTTTTSLQLPNGAIVPGFAKGYIHKQLRFENATQFCPKCLKDEAYYTSRWAPIAVSACLKHECLLVDRCQECNQAASLSAIVKARCGFCQADLTKANVISISGDALGLLAQKIIQSWLMENIMPPFAIPLLPQEPVTVLYQIIEDIQSSIILLSSMDWPYIHYIKEKPLSHIQKRLDEQILTPYESYRFYTTAYKSLVDWPNGFHRFLRSYRNKNASGRSSEYKYRYINEESGLIPGLIGANLGDLYSRLICQRWANPAFHFVQDVFNAHIAKNYWLNVRGDLATFCKKHPELAEYCKWVSIADAADLLKTSPKSVEALIETGQVDHKSFPQCENELVDRKQIISLNRTVDQDSKIYSPAKFALPGGDTKLNEKQSLSRQQELTMLMASGSAVRLLGLKESIIEDLAKVGLLIPQYSSARNGFKVEEYFVESVITFQNNILQRTKDSYIHELDGKEIWLNLKDVARLFSIIKLNVVTIFLHLMRDTIWAYLPQSQDNKLGDLLFTFFDVACLIESLKQRHILLDMQETSEVLGLSEEILKDWIKKCAIKPIAVYDYDLYFDRVSIDKLLITRQSFRPSSTSR